jgi:hypothetical protein
LTIFDYIDSLLFSKKEIEIAYEDATQFNAFMLNRWLSFYSPDMAAYINATGNSYASLFIDKNDLYKYYYNILPKCKFKRIAYIKKVKEKEEKDKEQEIIPEFSSSREYKINIELEEQLSK